MIIAVQKVFPNSKILLCSWHTSNNLKKHFMYLNRKKSEEAKKLYRKIINLPYCEYKEDYKEIYEEALRSEHLIKDSISY